MHFNAFKRQMIPQADKIKSFISSSVVKLMKKITLLIHVRAKDNLQNNTHVNFEKKAATTLKHKKTACKTFNALKSE